MRGKYSIGVDFGTLSARAVIVNLDNGDVINSTVKDYPDAVICNHLPGTTIQLGKDWALQNPRDYVICLIDTVKEAVSLSHIAKEDIISIGVDFTACTVLPVKNDGTPLCEIPEFRNRPHAWVKLWKHHAAQYAADKLNRIAQERNEPFLARYGGKISSEWIFPKLMQIVDEDPEIYQAMDRFIEAADWITWQMTGKETRNSCTAGYKAMWNEHTGYPDSSFFSALDPRLEHVVSEKLSEELLPVGSKAGELTVEMAHEMGLLPGISVCVGNVDAHVSVAPTGVITSGTMLNIMGTSTCDITLSDKEVLVPGMCGVVKNGAVPGYYAYESGQNAVGDIFAWFVDNQVPPSYFKEADQRNINIHQLLEEKANELAIGESGLLALDWWNGNRSVLVDTDLTGLILGMTLSTKPEEIYRALIEATAFGKRLVIDTFKASGVDINQLMVCGGLPHKNQMLNQIYADITQKEISIATHLQAPAIGAAMFAAVAAGQDAGGFTNIEEAAARIARIQEEKVKPIPENMKKYNALYQEYVKLHDYFGRGANDVMKVLKTLKSNSGKEESLIC
ncbi:ribulokinase [Peribacillus sp. ACCC06369]|uniref:ribulokinase n=1 Tax=Peribacillus sp. ACCC06369 TaxID=3055860 RepID=UPI0025A02565|nr:ribulokinase [Peribacillus sp. ACCC06369]MDM5358784.1 ribulokinase [Peribacillus sp. ACCC06369]